MAPNKRKAKKGKAVPVAQHPGGLMAGVKAIRPGKHRRAL